MARENARPVGNRTGPPTPERQSPDPAETGNRAKKIVSGNSKHTRASPPAQASPEEFQRARRTIIARKPRGAPREPASIYAGRECRGRVEPARSGAGYVARDVDGKRIGNFNKFEDAVAAVMASTGSAL